MSFQIRFSDNAIDDLKSLRKFDQTLILDQIRAQLTHEAASESRNRKLLDLNDLGTWELRVGNLRVFYDVDSAEGAVTIRAVGYKKHNVLFIRGKEYQL